MDRTERGEYDEIIQKTKEDIKKKRGMRKANEFTLKGVAESGFIWTMGEIRTTPAKSLGLSHAVRMEMAPP